MQRVWIEIVNPTENDKGKYTLEMFDGKEAHKRYIDLSGQGEGGEGGLTFLAFRFDLKDVS